MDEAEGNFLATTMDEVYWRGATEGNFRAFEGQNADGLLKLVRPNTKDTILHIHITARFNFLEGVPGKLFPSSIQSKLNLMLHKIKSESIDYMKEVLVKCKAMLWATNANDETLLHLAARYGHEDIVQLVLIENQKAEDEQAARRFLVSSNKAGDTALHEAARYNHPGVVKILLYEDRHHSYGPNKDGKTPLYLAAEMGNRKVVKILIDHSCSSPAYQGPEGKTALHAAVLRNHIVITKMLASSEKLKILGRKRDELGRIPLHYAAEKGFLRIVRILMEEDDSAAYIGDDKDHNMIALHVAAKHGRANVMSEIMSRCPQCCEMVDNNGNNLLHFVIESKSKRALDVALANRYVRNLVNKGTEEGDRRPLNLLPSTWNFSSALPLDSLPFLLWPIMMQITLKIFLPNLMILEREREDKDQGDIKSNGSEREDKDQGDIKSNGEQAQGQGSDDDNNTLDKDKRETLLVVAALIATVTFAAAFTMPGGYISDNGPEQGSPVLRNSVAFKVFVVSDIISLLYSSFAVLAHIIIVVLNKDESLQRQIRSTASATFCALIFMIVAFLAGSYAVLSHSCGWLATFAYVCPLLLPIILFMEFVLKIPSALDAVSYVISFML